MNLTVNITKQLEYKKATRLLIGRAIKNSTDQKNIIAEKRKGFFKKIVMPAEPKGYMKYKVNDPL